MQERLLTSEGVGAWAAAAGEEGAGVWAEASVGADEVDSEVAACFINTSSACPPVSVCAAHAKMLSWEDSSC